MKVNAVLRTHVDADLEARLLTANVSQETWQVCNVFGWWCERLCLGWWHLMPKLDQ